MINKFLIIVNLLVFALILWLVWQLLNTELNKVIVFEPIKIVAEVEDSPERILLVGDMMFDRYIRLMGQRNGEDYIFSCIADWLQEFDLVVGNLEGPITDNVSKSINSEIGSPNNFVFTFPSSTAAVLEKNNIKLVNLGNNHIYDFGSEGFISTKDYLDSVGIKYFGGYSDSELVYRYGEMSFISFNQFGNTLKQILPLISEEKSLGQTVLVYTHWGEEYETNPTYITDWARQLVEYGADIIVGSHPHVVAQSEWIEDSIVYYSVGNFIFDQYWDESVSSGLTLELIVNQDEIEIKEHPVKMHRDGRTCYNQLHDV